MTPSITNTFFAAVLVLTVGCSEQNKLEQMKQELKDYRSEIQTLKSDAAALEAEIVDLDPSFGKNDNNIILITTLGVEQGLFEHKIEVRGEVQSRRNVMMSAEIPGKIVRIRVKEGQRVSKGQVLVELDAEIIKNNIAELKTSLDLASVISERQSNLWKQNIGTEMQYLEAKNTKESLDRKLATANSQLSQAIIRAPFNGSIDAIPAREGEVAQPGNPLIRLVNPDDVYIKSDVSEKFLGSFGKNDEVEVRFPNQNKKLVSMISAVGQVINTNNRTFEIEIQLPSAGFPIQPNQVVILKMRDYASEEALKIPTRLILKDNKGSFVYKISKKGGQHVAAKAHVTLGVSFAGKTEILSGLSVSDVLADKGYRELADGVSVKLSKDQPMSMK